MFRNKFVFFLFLFLSIKGFAKPLEIVLTQPFTISKENQKIVEDILRYWIQAKTVYTIQKKADEKLIVNIRQTLNSYLLEVSLEDSKKNVTAQTSLPFYHLSEIFDALNEAFYNTILKGKILDLKRSYTVNPGLLDMAFIFDTTGSMKEEFQNFREEWKNIFSVLVWNHKTERIRFSFVDYKSIKAPYRAQKTDFSESTADLEKRLFEIQTVGKGEKSDSVFALTYALTYLNWTAEKRIILLVTDSFPEDKTSFLKAVEKARARGVRLFIIGCEGVREKEADFYKKAASSTGGNFLFLNYSLLYLLKDRSLKSFSFEYPALYETGKVKKDLTLGRKIDSVSQAQEFLKKNDYDILELKKMKMNWEEVIQKLTLADRKSIPIAYFESDDKQIFQIGIQDKETYHFLNAHKNERLIVGGHFFPYFDSVSLFPYTVFIKAEEPPRPIFLSIEKILQNPFFYFNHGIFRPPFWYVKLRFKGFQ